MDESYMNVAVLYWITAHLTAASLSERKGLSVHTVHAELTKGPDERGRRESQK